MRKKLVVTMTAVLLMLAVSGCASNVQTETEVSRTEAAESDTIPEIILPAQYRISYEVDNGDGTLSIITLEKDSKGNLYYRNAEEESWFLKKGTGYVQAMPDEEGELTSVLSGTILKFETVQEKTAPFWACAETSCKLLVPGFDHKGTAVIAGRTCDLHTYYMGIQGLNVTYQLYIDQETGICLGWMEHTETGIFDSEPQEGGDLPIVPLLWKRIKGRFTVLTSGALQWKRWTSIAVVV